MRRAGALLDNAQKITRCTRRDISIVHDNERPSDVIQYFTPLRHNRAPPVLFFFLSPFRSDIYIYHSRTRARN